MTWIFKRKPMTKHDVAALVARTLAGVVVYVGTLALLLIPVLDALR
jgi:hypothetical protein